MRRQGVVTWFSEEKGFGFVQADDGTEAYVHFTEIERDGFATLHEGERVSFEVVDEDRGPKALSVRPESR